MTLPASEETAVPATDAEISELEKEIDAGEVRNSYLWLSLIARIRSEREQAVRECAEKLNDYIAASRSDTEALGFEQARDVILSLSQVSAKK